MLVRKRIPAALCPVAFFVAWGVLAGLTASAQAATRTVTNLNDSGSGSLRDAVTQSNTNAGMDRIVFSSGLSGTISLSSTLTISDDVSIEGPGPRAISVNGGNARGLFVVTSLTAASFSGLRFANGFADRGAAIAFSSPGLLSVSDCHFDQNLATADGGAILLFSGSLSARRCTFTTNQAAGSGGCIWWGQGGGTPTVDVANCTFVNNFASNAGGALRQFSTTSYSSKVTNCTFVVNNAGNAGGAIALAGGTMSLHNALLTANGAGGNPGGHILAPAGTLTSLGHNLIGHIDGADFTPAEGDKFGTAAAQLNTGILIAFPFNNGGLTDTLPFSSSTSIAIDGGSPDTAAPGDQRDFPRVGCAPDVGAFEVQTPLDTDGDGVINCLDQCANTPACAAVNEHGCPIDTDGDGVADGCDQCPATSAGDVVDPNGCALADEDGDGVLNDVDQCRGTPACAIAHVNAVGCPTDADGDGLFDGCDQCPGSNDLTDSDGDGIPDCLDACPNAADTDGDGVQDCLDGCPTDPLKRDPGGCGCNHADTDADGDGVADCVDQCPNTPTCAAVNAQGCPIDSDADGVADGCDQCPGTLAGDTVDAHGCSLVDEDHDGVLNDADRCRGTPACAVAFVDTNGCPVDSDSDGIWDGCDLCPGTNDRLDNDGDGIPNCLDACPDAGDTDGDGVQDCQDACPADPLKREPGACGCGQPDSDANGNGVPDCLDAAIAQASGQTTPTDDTGSPSGAIAASGAVCGAGLAPAMALMVSLFFIKTGRRRVGRRRRESNQDQ